MNKQKFMKDVEALVNNLLHDVEAEEESIEPEKINGLTIPEWRQLAELGDVLVEVKGSKRYLKEIFNTDKPFACYVDGKTFETTTNTFSWSKAKLIESTRWRHNPGKQPVPGSVIVEVELMDGTINSQKAYSYTWSLSESACDIKCYRIIGADETR